MTAPGDPLIAGGGGSKYQSTLETHSAFAQLRDQIEALMVRRSNAETQLLWTKKAYGQSYRGYIATLESVNTKRETGTFQVHYVAVNDKRNPTALTFGVFKEEAKAALVKNFGGERVKGGQS